MARVDEITRVLNSEHGPIPPRALGGFRPVRRQDVLHIHVVVAEEAIGRLGLRPLATRLIDRTLGHLGQSPTELDEPCGPSLIPQGDTSYFLPRPFVVAPRLHPSLHPLSK